MTDIFELNWRQIGRAVVSAVIMAVLAFVGNMTSLTDLDGKQVLSVIILTVITSLSKALASDSQGKFGGVL